MNKGIFKYQDMVWRKTREDCAALAPCMPRLIIERLSEDAVIPTYASEGDSGMDVYATKSVLLEPGNTVLMKLGFKMGIPRHPFHELGYRWECQARPRSGVSLNTSLRVANAPGTIDNFYTDEVGIILTNTAQRLYDFNKDKRWIIDHSEDSVEIVEDANFAINTSSDVYDLKGNVVPISSLKDLFPDRLLPLELPRGTVLIRKGERIAQLVFAEVIRPLEIVEGKVDESVSRGGGFGHSGV